MMPWKNKKKNLYPILHLIEDKFSKAQAKNEPYFYYPLTEKEYPIVKEYFESHYGMIIEPDHKTDNIIIYKFYGYRLYS